MVNTSLFELFKVGIGPSSSHTVGPMRAALRFARELEAGGQIGATARVLTELYGSLALTGVGHATDRAVLLGLAGCAPDTVEPGRIEEQLRGIRASGVLRLGGVHSVGFDEARDLVFRRDEMYPPPGVVTHPNGVRFRAMDATGVVLLERVFYSIGGGFIKSAEEFDPGAPVAVASRLVPYPFRSARELLECAARHELSVAGLMLGNEVALLADPSIPRPYVVDDGGMSAEGRVEAGVLALFGEMRGSAERGLVTEGVLPGGLKVQRRAARLARKLRERAERLAADPLAAMDWVNVYAMAVNEENAAGGRVVTAPTNGAAGVIPAIALYLVNHVVPGPTARSTVPRAARSFGDNWDGPGWGREPEGAVAVMPAGEASLTAAQRTALLRFFLTAAAIGILYKENASISGAEVGCQGEVGVACSMAAGGLAAALGGTNAQVEHAAEIGMEHNLGMTCDPIGGLVQIPCIERNGMGAVKAINAARLAMADTETHKLSLDQVIETMYRTGMDMQSRYKETSLGGLALNVIEC